MEKVESQRKYEDLIVGLEKGAKVLGAAALSGAAGYATAKGIEIILPIQEEHFFEGVVVGAYTVLGGFVAFEAI